MYERQVYIGIAFPLLGLSGIKVYPSFHQKIPNSNDIVFNFGKRKQQMKHINYFSQNTTRASSGKKANYYYNRINTNPRSMIMSFTKPVKCSSSKRE